MLVKSKVEGMTCGNCALTISKYLEKSGASNITANPSTGDVVFEVVENGGDLLNGINKLGYTVVDANVTVPNSGKGQHAHQHSKMSVKNLLWISLLLWLPLIAHMFTEVQLLHNVWFQFALATPVYMICLFYFGKSAWRSIVNKIANMDVLIFIGASAAYVYSILGWIMHPEHVHAYLFFETTASIVTLVLLGNYLEELSVKTTTNAIASLSALQKTNAKLIMVDSIGKETIQVIENNYLKVNDLVQLNTGDKVPVDAIIVSGQVTLDESMMTGESIPITRNTNQYVTGGTIVLEGNACIKATGVGEDTALARILQMVNEAQSIKSPMQKLADKISAIFVPVVLAISVLTFFIAYVLLDLSLASAMMRSIAVLVVACPCAMGLATPAAVMVGLGRAAKNGILIRGADTLEQFKNIKQIVLDKTGTLTSGNIQLGEFKIVDGDEMQLKQVLYSIESYSSHPIATALCKTLKTFEGLQLTEVKEEKGIGLRAKDGAGNIWEVGSHKMLKVELGETYDMYIICNGILKACIKLIDELKPNAKQVIGQFKQMGIQPILLSGDRREKCEDVAQKLGIDIVYWSQSPEQKLLKIKELMQVAPTAMVGDGVNDAPALMQSSIGISFSEATQIASQSAKVILLKNDLAQIPYAIGLGKHTYLTIKQNLYWAFLYNIVSIPVAAAGLLTPTFGAGLMALSDVVLVLNSLRLRWKRVV